MKTLESSVGKYPTTYYMAINAIHSGLHSNKKKLKYDNETTVEKFRDNNDEICLLIFNSILERYNYETSHNQMMNGINLFLKAETP